MGTFDQLPQDLLGEILSRLPVKCLIRLVCVCKTWGRLIRHPEFIQLHLSHANKTTSPRKLLLRPSDWPWHNYYFLASESDPVVEEFSLPEEPKYDGLTGSCNGLVCLYQIRGTLVSLFNPTTRQLKALPSSPIVGHRWSKLSTVVGFGLDRITKDLKVVRIIFGGYPEDVVFIEVYSLANDTWREIHPTNDLSPIKNCRCSWEPYYNRETSLADGVYYWVITPQGSRVKQVMLSFDFSDEVFEMIPLPRRPRLYVESVGSFQGCLSVISRHYRRGSDYSIWIRGYNNDNKKAGWRGKKKSFTGLNFCPRLIGFWNNKVVSEKSQVVFLSDSHKTKAILAGSLGLYRATEYVESLVLFR